MLNFFDAIIANFENLFSVIGNFLSSLVSFMVIVPQVAAFPLQLIGYIPSLISTCILCVVSIGVIKLLLGWGNS